MPTAPAPAPSGRNMCRRSSRRSFDRERGCLIDISADGSIDPDELADFLRIQRELEQISQTVEALQLWAEKMMADGRIDRAAYTREISAAGEK